MTAISQRPARPRVFYGWWIVIACGLLGLLSSSARFSFTMFFPRLLDDLGWTRTGLSFGFTLSWWVSSSTSLAIGFVVDRYGPRLVMVLGGLLTLVGLLLASRMTSVWQFYLSFGVILAVGGGLAHGVPATATARKWFTRKAGLAVSISSVGGGMGLGAIALVAPALLRAYDWRGGWFYLGLVLGAAIMLVAGIVIRKDPESVGLLPDGDPPLPEPQSQEWPGRVTVAATMGENWTVREALRTRTYWYLIVGNALVSVPLMSGLTHMANWGVDICHLTNVPVDQGMETIKIAVFASAISAVLGALIGGPLSDRIGRKPVLLISFALYSSALFYCFLISSVIPSLLGVLLSGLAAGFFYGLGMGLWTAYLGDLFGRTSLGSLSGLHFFIGGLIGGGGPVIYGLIRDTTGSYSPAWALGTVLAVIVFVLMTRTQPPVQRPRPINEAQRTKAGL